MKTPLRITEVNDYFIVEKQNPDGSWSDLFCRRFMDKGMAEVYCHVLINKTQNYENMVNYHRHPVCTLRVGGYLRRLASAFAGCHCRRN